MLKNKKVIVTGGSQGIGRGIALAMAKAGADVLIQYRSAKSLAAAACEEITSQGYNAYLMQCDFSIENERQGFVGKAIECMGDIDILVNCAAAYDTKPFLDVSCEDLRLMHLVNVEAPMILSQHFAKYCIENKKHGNILNVASISGTMPSKNSLLNSCSKASLIMLTRGVALELAESNIRVNAIAPGMVDTESNAAFKNGDPDGWKRAIDDIPLGVVGTPQNCGDLAVFLTSDKSTWITGAVIPIDGGMTISWK